jgi:hypothetical protein
MILNIEAVTPSHGMTSFHEKNNIVHNVPVRREILPAK